MVIIAQIKFLQTRTPLLLKSDRL